MARATRWCLTCGVEPRCPALITAVPTVQNHLPNTLGRQEGRRGGGPGGGRRVPPDPPGYDPLVWVRREGRTTAQQLPALAPSSPARRG